MRRRTRESYHHFFWPFSTHVSASRFAVGVQTAASSRTTTRFGQSEAAYFLHSSHRGAISAFAPPSHQIDRAIDSQLWTPKKVAIEASTRGVFLMMKPMSSGAAASAAIAFIAQRRGCSGREAGSQFEWERVLGPIFFNHWPTSVSMNRRTSWRWLVRFIQSFA